MRSNKRTHKRGHRRWRSNQVRAENTTSTGFHDENKDENHARQRRGTIQTPKPMGSRIIRTSQDHGSVGLGFGVFGFYSNNSQNFTKMMIVYACTLVYVVFLILLELEFYFLP